VRSEFNPGLLCSVASKTAEVMTATSRRVLIDGPVANKSFIADASYQLKNTATRVRYTQVTARINDLNEGRNYSNEKVEIPFLSSISKTMPPPLATQVSGSSAICTGRPVSSAIKRSISFNKAPPPVK
jgi:hypothetical protein